MARLHTDAEREAARRLYEDGVTIPVIARRMRIERTVLVRWLLYDSVSGAPDTPKALESVISARTDVRPKTKKSKVEVLSTWQGLVDLYGQLEAVVREGKRAGIVRCLNRLSRQCKIMRNQVK